MPNLVAGVLIADVKTTTQETLSKTKYDEDTGKPYQRVTVVKKTFIGTIEIPEVFLDFYGLEYKEGDENVEKLENLLSLKVFRSCRGDDPEILGMAVATTELKWTSAIAVDFLSIQPTIAEVETKLRAIGIDKPASLFLI